jgi:hypothetical protein
MKSGLPMVIPEIIFQHVEEAAFLWLLQSNATRAPHYAMKDLAKLDGRVRKRGQANFLASFRLSSKPATIVMS